MQTPNYSPNSFQAKIDDLINDANMKISTSKNDEIGALVSYSKSLDLFDFLGRFYPIQLHEIQVKISFCWEILGNAKTSLTHLNKAMRIIPNIPTLILYKSVLLQSLNQTDESQKFLLKFKQLGGNNLTHNFYYDTFRLIYIYILQYEEDIILREIDDYLIKYKELANKIVVIYYIRAQMYANLASKFNIEEKRKNILISRYEENIMKANNIQPSDTNYLIQENISNENITKIFLIIIPNFSALKPKPLIEYKRNITGFRVFYLIFKAIKLFKINIEKKKIKQFYMNKMSYYKRNNTISNCNNNNSSFTETKVNTKDEYSSFQRDKMNTVVNDKNDLIYTDIEEIQREYQNSVRKLYKSVWINEGTSYSTILPTNEILYGNYFINNGYYSKDNINPVIMKYIQQNNEFKIKEKKNDKIYLSISKVNLGRVEIKKNKTPIKFGTNLRIKIQKAMSNNQRNKKRQNYFNTNISSNTNNNNNNHNKKDSTNKSGNLSSNSKNIGLINQEDSSSLLNNENKKKNTTHFDISKFPLGSHFHETLAIRQTNRKKEIKEKKIKYISNFRNLNIVIPQFSKSKEKSTNNQRNQSNLIQMKIFSNYNKRQVLTQGPILGRNLVNSSSTKNNRIKHSSKSSINKSEESKNDNRIPNNNQINGNNLCHNINQNTTNTTNEKYKSFF